ncbi:MAG: hypothetical protein HDKAJFGB_01526 [Anaerolineae bacterium]|nr:hypothetical protein [Anaerolineae bacterium]
MRDGVEINLGFAGTGDAVYKKRRALRGRVERAADGLPCRVLFARERGRKGGRIGLRGERVAHNLNLFDGDDARALQFIQIGARRVGIGIDGGGLERRARLREQRDDRVQAERERTL